MLQNEVWTREPKRFARNAKLYRIYPPNHVSIALSLPEELLLLILLFLDNVWDLAAVAQTCRVFRRLAFDKALWRTVDLLGKIVSRHELGKCRHEHDRFEGLQSFRSATWSTSISQFLRPKLHTLLLTFNISVESIRIIISSCPQLKTVSLRIYDDEVSDVLLAFSKTTVIQRFQLHHGRMTRVANQTFEALVAGCPELQELILPNASMDHLGWMALSRLRKLERAYFCPMSTPDRHVNDASVERDFLGIDRSGYFPALQDLKLERAPYWWNFMPALDTLQALDTVCHYGRENDMRFFSTWAPGVTNLGIEPACAYEMIGEPPPVETATPHHGPDLITRLLPAVRHHWPKATALRRVAITPAQAGALACDSNTLEGFVNLGIIITSLEVLSIAAAHSHLTDRIDRIYINTTQAAPHYSLFDVSRYLRPFKHLTRLTVPTSLLYVTIASLFVLFQKLPEHEIEVILSISAFSTSEYEAYYHGRVNFLPIEARTRLHRMRPKCSLFVACVLESLVEIGAQSHIQVL